MLKCGKEVKITKKNTLRCPIQLLSKKIKYVENNSIFFIISFFQCYSEKRYLMKGIFMIFPLVYKKKKLKVLKQTSRDFETYLDLIFKLNKIYVSFRFSNVI